MRHRLTAAMTATVVLALAVFTGTSLAGNGNGTGTGGGSTQSAQNSQSSQHAQTTTSHPTKPSTPAKATKTTKATKPASSTSHGGGSSSKQSSTSASNPATGGNNSTGVKPTNKTFHNTWATASSGSTKQYGNGKTAGQIATQAGQPNAVLHGPGNSQPHKTTVCGHSHEVDVHALKSKLSSCASGTPPAAPATPSKPSAGTSMAHVTICHATGSATNPYVRISPSAAGVYHGHLGHQDGRDIVPTFTYNGQTVSENWDANGQAIYNNGCVAPSGTAAASTLAPAAASPLTPAAASTQSSPATAAISATSTPAPTAIAAGGVKGATATLKPATKPVGHVAAAATKSKPHGGVLGATTRLGHVVSSTRLPFTGLPLWIFVAVAAALILTGAGLRRSAGNRA